MPDNVLRVAAEFDVAPIIAGTQKAVASFNELGTAVQIQAARFAESGLAGTDLVSALTNLGYSSKDATEAVAALGTAAAITDPQIAALQTQVNQLTGSLERATLAAKESSSGMGGFRGAMGEARVEAGALTGSTGMMVGGLARIAAQSSTLAPIISELFPLFGAVAFIAILGDVISEFGKASDAVMGYTDEVKKAEKADEAFSEKALEGARSLADADSKLANINAELARVEGEAFSEKYANAARDHQHAVLDFLGPLGNLVNVYLALAHAEGDAADQAARLTTGERAQMINTDEQRAELDKRAITLIKDKAAASEAAMASDIDKTRAQIAALDQEETKQRQLAALEEGIAAAKSGNIKPDLAGVDANVVADYAAKRLELENKLTVEEKKLGDERAAAAIESEKQTGLATLDARTQAITQLRALNQINADQEASLLRIVEGNRYDIEVKAASDKIALLKTEGPQHLAEVNTLNGQLLDLSIKHDAKMAELRDKATLEDKKAYQEAARGLQEEFLRDLERRAKELEEQKKQELASQVEGYTAQIEAAREGAARIEEANRAMFELRDENLRTYEAKAVAEYELEYETQAAILANEAALIRKAAADRVLTEEEASKKLQAIWAEEAKNYSAMTQQIEKVQLEAERKQDQSIDAISKKWAQDWVAMTNSVLKGQTTIGAALVHMAAQMELQLIDKGIAFVVSKTAEYLLKLLAAHVSFLAQLLGIQVAGNASAIAAEKVKQLAIVTSEAGVSAAAGFASTMVALPFPVNIEVAPATAATAGSSTLAVGAAFEQGGDVRGTGLALLHDQEHVLDHPISAALRGAIPAIQRFNSALSPNSTGAPSISKTGGGTRDIHVHINHQGSNMTQADMVKAVKQGIRKGQIGAARF